MDELVTVTGKFKLLYDVTSGFYRLTDAVAVKFYIYLQHGIFFLYLMVTTIDRTWIYKLNINIIRKQ